MEIAVLFDQDGTLLDSAPGIKQCAIETLEMMGIPSKPYQELDYFIGPPLRDCFRLSSVPEDRIDEAVDMFRKLYKEKGAFNATVYPHIPELLKKLKEAGYKVFVCTSKGMPVAVDILTHFSLISLFDGVYGATLDGKVTKKKDIIARCLNENKPDLAFMVGDTYLDVEGANANGIKTIGVSYGYGDKKKMKGEGAAAFIDDPLELIEIIQNLIKTHTEIKS